MKNLIFFFFLALSFQVFAQDEEASQSIMWESIILEPDPESIVEFRENMRAHNMKYHSEEGPYMSYVYTITTGPNVGKVVWMMGPCSWTDLDNRPAADGHDMDWMQNVVTKLEGMEHAEYWLRNDELSKESTGEQYPLIYVRYHNISKSEGYRAGGLLKKISATIKSIDAAKSWSVYDNLMRQGYETGRHIAMVSGMKSWSEMDDDWGFVEAFEKIHGPNSFDSFAKEMDTVTTNSWDEVWAFDAYMSGRPE